MRTVTPQPVAASSALVTEALKGVRLEWRGDTAKQSNCGPVSPRHYSDREVVGNDPFNYHGFAFCAKPVEEVV